MSDPFATGDAVDEDLFSDLAVTSSTQAAGDDLFKNLGGSDDPVLEFLGAAKPALF